MLDPVVGVVWAGCACAASVGGEQVAQEAVQLHVAFSMKDDAPMVGRRERPGRLILFIAPIACPSEAL